MKKPTADELLMIIRKHCLVCSGSRSEVKRCLIKDCMLYPYRLPLTEKSVKKKAPGEQMSIFDIYKTEAS